MALEDMHDSHDIHFEDEIFPDLIASNRRGVWTEDVRCRLLDSYRDFGPWNVSFTEYMKRFHQLKPELVALTANSAVPVADAVRGWYEEVGEEQPELTYVRANRDLTKKDLSLEEQHTIEQDVERLEREYAGAHAVIIDQFVETGKTLTLATRMLGRAGLMIVGSTPEAKWYNHAFGKIDLSRVTSEHASFMRRIGQEAVHYLTNESRLR